MGGILSNIIVLILFLSFKLYLKFPLIYRFNNMMIVFNLIIVYPLDGYQILYTLLGMIYDDLYTYDILKYISIINMVIIFMCTIIFKNVMLGVILFILIIKFFQNMRYHRLNYLKNTQSLANYFYFIHK